MLRCGDGDSTQHRTAGAPFFPRETRNTVVFARLGAHVLLARWLNCKDAGTADKNANVMISIDQFGLRVASEKNMMGRGRKILLSNRDRIESQLGNETCPDAYKAVSIVPTLADLSVVV